MGFGLGMVRGFSGCLDALDGVWLSFHVPVLFYRLRVFGFQTRLLVTHSTGFLPQVDQIIVLQDGRISEVIPGIALVLAAERKEELFWPGFSSSLPPPPSLTSSLSLPSLPATGPTSLPFCRSLFPPSLHPLVHPTRSSNHIPTQLSIHPFPRPSPSFPQAPLPPSVNQSAIRRPPVRSSLPPSTRPSS